MIHQKKPSKFEPIFEVVSCFCQFEDKFILLLRQDHKSEGNKWGPPAGKVDKNEDIFTAIQRELFEETGIERTQDLFTHQKKFFVRYPDYDFIYHVFQTELEEIPQVQIRSDEHKDFRWVTKEESLSMNLVLGQDIVNQLML